MMWNDLVTTALLGTERRALKLDDAGEPFREIAAALADQEPERALLALAGSMALYRRAGQSPDIDTSPLLDLCDLDDLPPCSPRAGLILQQIVALPGRAIHLQEWLAAAAAAGQRLTDEYLPLLLSTFERRADLPVHFFDVLGKRGRWLARQNPAWAYAVLPETDAEWELASFPARLIYLRRLRAADPARGRALVESVWQTESAEVRAALLRALEGGLSLEDEPFLEAARNDRAIRVRAGAVGLLALLPNSDYSRDLVERARPLIHIGWHKHLLLKELKVELTLPEWDDALMNRDAVSIAPLEAREDTLTMWLYHVAVRLPISFWLGGGWTAPELIQAARANEQWKGRLLNALAQVAKRHDQAELALSLLESGELDANVARSMLEILPPAAREAYLLGVVEEARPSGSLSKAFALLVQPEPVTYHWSRPLTLAVISAIREIVPGQNILALDALIINLPGLARQCSPTCLHELEALATIESKNKNIWVYNVKRAAETLEFRQKMYKEFAR